MLKILVTKLLLVHAFLHAAHETQLVSDVREGHLEAEQLLGQLAESERVAFDVVDGHVAAVAHHTLAQVVHHRLQITS